MTREKHQVGTTALLASVTIAAFCLTMSAAFAHGIHGDQARMLKYGGPLSYFWAGATHMLTGYDHLLFLFGVMFFLTNLKDIVTFITAFTIGHSITLIAATLYGVQANYYLIDAVIAISVVYKGFDNLDGFRKWFGITPPNLLGMVFGFGLIHGFGLATRLQNIGLPDDGLTPRLLAFNAGVELGQIAALAAMMLLLALLRRTQAFAPFTIISNATLVIAGSLLFLMQMHGYQHIAYPDEFGFSTNQHILDHYKNDVPSGDDIQPPTVPNSQSQTPGQ
ncbi:HupE/UreJ family protein [Hyphomicrobium sp. 2TAF46]|uniref:HupE/UreJ family protein n=1 Tax=Hyphomicrobium sp. 2TAF46 TaxID=3233019 RepID=UPI003F8E1EF7